MEYDMSDISVVLATFNGVRYLQAQLDSIVGQTLRPAEIVISDDQSTDGTVQFVAEYARSAPIPIHIAVNEMRLGFADNFLNATSRATGSLIAFSDQDDIWRPDKLRVARDAMALTNSSLSTHQVNHVDEQGQFIRFDAHGSTKSRVLKPGEAEPFGLFFGFTMLFDARLLDLLPFSQRGVDDYTERDPLPHDRWLHFLGTNFGRTVLIDEPLAYYRQHGSQAWGARPTTLVARASQKAHEGPRRLRFLADLARERAHLIDKLRPEESRSLVEEAAWSTVHARWVNIALAYGARAELYAESTLSARARELAALASAGTYAVLERGGLGRKRALEDLSVGLFRPFYKSW